jgi:hypothetical protein
MVWHTIKEVADTYEAFARIAGQVGPGVAMIRSGDGSAGTASRVPDVELRSTRAADGVATDEEWALKRGSRQRIPVQHSIAAHVEDVAALNRRHDGDLIPVYEVPQHAASDLQRWCVDQVPIERVVPVSQRIAAVSATDRTERSLGSQCCSAPGRHR